MKFLIDAQLPYLLCEFLNSKGLDSIHTDDLPNKERTTDREIIATAAEQDRIVISKDLDFLDSYLLNGIPAKLLWVTTGNIQNRDLLKLFTDHIETIIQLFQNYSLVELSNEILSGHD